VTAPFTSLLGPGPGLLGAASSVIPTPQVRYLAILPELVMLGGAVLLLAVASLVGRPLRVRVATGGTVAVSAAALGLALWQWYDVQDHGPYTTLVHGVVVDGFSSLVAILVPCAMLLTALVADGYLQREGVEGPEVHVLAMVSASGAMIMAQANDLIVVFLGLEILSIALYVLAALNHRRVASGEAGLKYFILGSFSSAIFVYGIALTYGATGSSNLTQIADFLSRNVVARDGLLLAGLSLLLVGFLFKVAAVPFHMWTPDVYDGAPSPVTGFMAAVAKVGGFAALLRVFISSFGVLRADWQPIIYGVAVVTLLLGAGLAVVQRNIKRMMAYSSINHAGFVLLGLQAATTRGVSASLYYLFAYTFMVIGSFAVITVLGRRGDADHDIASYRGLARRQPALALAFAVLLLAQAGAPFTTGLWAKLQVVLAAVDANSVPLAAIAMASAALAAFFYLRVAILMYSPAPAADAPAGVQEAAEAPVLLWAGAGATDGGGAGSAGAVGPAPSPAAGSNGHRVLPLWAGSERNLAVVTRMNAGLLLDAEAAARTEVAGEPSAPAGEPSAPELPGPPADRPPVPVPVGSEVAIALCTAVTVVFGFWPAPLVDLASKATLFFHP
jgi:NADH-quinone oxidoreductase subunit N